MQSPPEPEDCLRKVYVEITTECNLDCRMCMRHTWHETEARMTPATFQKLLEQLRAIRSAWILHFGGFGEPMVHPDLFDFLDRAKHAGLRTELITNGLLVDRTAAERLVEVGLDKIVVSLDGVGPRQDEALHQSSVEQVRSALRELYRTRLVRRSQRPEIGVQFVATRRNIHELPQLKRLAPMLGFSSILVSNLVPHTADMADQTLYRRWSTARCNLDPSPWNPMIELPPMDVRSEADATVEELCFSGTRVRRGEADLSAGGMRCRFVEEGRLAVACDGSVSPCLPLLHAHSYYFHGELRQLDAYRVGNVNDAPLAALWESEEYRAFRQRVRRFEFSPCIDCGGCDLRATNREDCFGGPPPRCGACLWAAGLVQCP